MKKFNPHKSGATIKQVTKGKRKGHWNLIINGAYSSSWYLTQSEAETARDKYNDKFTGKPNAAAKASPSIQETEKACASLFGF